MKKAAFQIWPIVFLLLSGCASGPKQPEPTVQPGMTREQVRMCFGEPLRIERNDGGGEDWYYRFVSWKTRPTGSTEQIEQSWEKTDYVTLGLGFNKQKQEQAIHLSADGRVVAPLPKGKIVVD
jgi:outer membrane protein assembly factor BamE (lipoprotein component of BamABCDE complex)